jgi:DNA-binding LytR/AlgR family response regulator
MASDLVVNCCDLSGTYDLMFELAVPDMEAYCAEIEAIKARLGTLFERCEANFVCKRFARVPNTEIEDVIWVPCDHGLKRVQCKCIDKVTAERDYVCVHCGPDKWLLHMTMRDMLSKLPDAQFAQVHRSAIVRCAVVERLLHEGHSWWAKLCDGSRQRIAKSHVPEVLTKLGIEQSASKPETTRKVQTIVEC